MFKIIFSEPFQLFLSNGAPAGSPLQGEYEAERNDGQQAGWYALSQNGEYVANIHIDSRTQEVE